MLTHNKSYFLDPAGQGILQVDDFLVFRPFWPRKKIQNNSNNNKKKKEIEETDSIGNFVLTLKRKISLNYEAEKMKWMLALFKRIPVLKCLLGVTIIVKLTSPIFCISLTFGPIF